MEAEEERIGKMIVEILVGNFEVEVNCSQKHLLTERPADFQFLHKFVYLLLKMCILIVM